MSTTITLTELFAAPVSDLSDTLSLRVRTETDQVVSPATIRRYAAGRDRIVTTPGETRRVTFTAVNVPRTDYDTLTGRLGVLQLFREPRGRRVWGTIIEIGGEEWRARADTLGSVQFTVISASYDEAV